MTLNKMKQNFIRKDSDRTVSVIVIENYENVILIQEDDESISTFAGHSYIGENLKDAAERELMEESAAMFNINLQNVSYVDCKKHRTYFLFVGNINLDIYYRNYKELVWSDVPDSFLETSNIIRIPLWSINNILIPKVVRSDIIYAKNNPKPITKIEIAKYREGTLRNLYCYKN